MRSSDWLAEQINGLTDEIVSVSPSEWAEEHRRLTPTVTSLPGPYRYSVAPYLREIADCMDVRSPVREISIMKGAQTGGTVGVAENAIGYFIAHVKTAPMMLVTADQPLATLRMDQYITPMLQQSGLAHLIQSNSDNARKAGKTDRKMSWFGGGFLIPTGSNAAASLRSISARVMILDELDSYPLNVGNDGDPGALAKARTKGFSKSRKILRISTPTTTARSRILREFEAGDQRRYKMPCLGCGEFQEIKWEHKDKDGKRLGGIVWDTDDRSNVTPGSVMYACKFCGHCHTNEHKREMLPLGKWVPTAIPRHPSFRSYHISALISPSDFYSWEDAVVDWLAAWNVDTNRARDFTKLQEFYNNVLGEAFSVTGAKLTVGKVARHQRQYNSGKLPATIAKTMTGGQCLGFLTCAADIHKGFISAAVYAHAPGRLGFLIERHNFPGDTTDPHCKEGPWSKLEALIGKKYNDGQGREYPVMLTLVDSAWSPSLAYSFCAGRPTVFPHRGDITASGGGREFDEIKDASRSGQRGWRINVNHYKDRLHAVLTCAPRPDGEVAMVDSVSFPCDIEDAALKELTAEEKIQTITTKGKKVWEWHRKGRNELWDLTVYNAAARDIVAFLICREHYESDEIDWARFWVWADQTRFGWAEAAPIADE